MDKVYILHVTYWSDTIEMLAFATKIQVEQHIELFAEDWVANYYDWNVITLDIIK